MTIIGVNATTAGPAGITAAATAEGFKGLAEEFRGTTSDSDKAAGRDPGIPGGFTPFGVAWVDALTWVEHHGKAVGHNITHGAGLSTQNDAAIRYLFSGVSVPPINGH